MHGKPLLTYDNRRTKNMSVQPVFRPFQIIIEPFWECVQSVFCFFCCCWCRWCRRRCCHCHCRHFSLFIQNLQMPRKKGTFISYERALGKPKLMLMLPNTWSSSCLDTMFSDLLLGGEWSCRSVTEYFFRSCRYDNWRWVSRKDNSDDSDDDRNDHHDDDNVENNKTMVWKNSKMVRKR